MNEKYIFSGTSRFNQKRTQGSGTALESENKYYTMSGYESFNDDNGKPCADEKDTAIIFAKQTTREDGTKKYSIRLDKDKKMFNPVSIYGNKDLRLLENISRNNKQYKEVNQKVFDMYLQFLSTKNTAWLHNAERESE